MKEHLQKIASLYADIAKAAKEGDNTTLIAKLEEAGTAIETATTEAGVADETATTQATEIEKMQGELTEIKKWADMYVSAESFAKLLADVKSVTDKVTGLETVVKTVEDLGAKVETIAKTSVGSKQVEGQGVTPIAKTVLGWLAARL